MVAIVERQGRKIPKLWADSLDICPKYIGDTLQQDDELMKKYYLETYNKSNRIKAKIKDRYIDEFIINLLNRKAITISIMNKLILDYFKNNKNEYDNIMDELDKLLIKPIEKKPIINMHLTCDCKSIGFGFCFCTNFKGEKIIF